MKDEISAAVLFLVRFIEKSDKFPRDKLDAFKSQLIELLTERFKNHWFPDCPAKGQGYRCIRVNELHPVDVVLQKAAAQVGLSYNDLQLPIELTLWVDPNEVCCRFGESEGSYCTLATFSEKENQLVLTESNTMDRSVSPASDVSSSSSTSSSGSVELNRKSPTNYNIAASSTTQSTQSTTISNTNASTNHHPGDMKKGGGTPKKYRNKHSMSPVGGYNNYSHHHSNKHLTANNLIRHGGGGGVGSGNRGGNGGTHMSGVSNTSAPTWRTNYYDILPHFALNNGGSSYVSGYNNYNRSSYPRVSQFQNVLTV